MVAQRSTARPPVLAYIVQVCANCTNHTRGKVPQLGKFKSEFTHFKISIFLSFKTKAWKHASRPIFYRKKRKLYTHVFFHTMFLIEEIIHPPPSTLFRMQRSYVGIWGTQARCCTRCWGRSGPTRGSTLTCLSKWCLHTHTHTHTHT